MEPDMKVEYLDAEYEPVFEASGVGAIIGGAIIGAVIGAVIGEIIDRTDW